MKKILFSIFLCACLNLSHAQSVLIRTNMGDITVAMEPKSPASVKNFLNYVDSGFYTGLIFHRVIGNFMIQGGGFNADMQEKPTLAPVKNESNNYVRNERGTLAMARTNDPNSATSQFFINLKKNGSLDYRFGKPGYSVFAHVTSGMEVVDKIAKVQTANRGRHGDVPVKAVTILEMKRLSE